MKNQKLWTLIVFLFFAGLHTAKAQIYTNGSNDVYTTDEFGIDKTNPLEQLHIKASGDRCIRLEEDGGGTEYVTLGIDNDGDFFLELDSGYDALSVSDATGYVGISTLSPAYHLDVNGDMRVRGGDIFSSGHLRLNANSGGYVDVKPSNSSYGLLVREYNSSDYGNIEVTSSGLGFGYRTGGAHLMISTSGNVGIGTTSPEERLHVEGRVKIGSWETLSDIGNGTMGINSNLIPTDVSNGFRNLGNSSRPWANIYMSGSLIQSSDKRLKSNIKGLEYGLEEIMQLRPVSYKMKDAPDDKRLGLIAQELQTVIRELVSSTEVVADEEGGTKKSVATEHLGVNYLDLIPVLIKGMQEQQVLIEEQSARIDQLEAQLSSDSDDNTSPRPNSTNATPQSTGKVFQNNPNPFKNNTRISYELPKNVRQANLLVTDMTGKQVASYELTGQRIGEVTVNADGLPTGTYIYVLVADGKPVAQNKMVIAK